MKEVHGLKKVESMTVFTAYVLYKR